MRIRPEVPEPNSHSVGKSVPATPSVSRTSSRATPPAAESSDRVEVSSAASDILEARAIDVPAAGSPEAENVSRALRLLREGAFDRSEHRERLVARLATELGIDPSR